MALYRLGQFRACLLQAAVSGFLFVYFSGPFPFPTIPFALLGHIMAPTLLSKWLDMIHDMTR
jgi:hypothetical protein